MNQVSGAIFLLLFATCATYASSFTDEAPSRLSEYIRVETVNPPGNEIRGAEFFASIFDQAGIKYKVEESAPGRGNIWARLKGGKKPGLVLLNHIDVVPADLKYWSSDPYDGAIRDGHIYGRGTLDMKGLAIAQLQAFLELNASGAKLNRDIIFVATADEEAGGAFGAGWLVEHHPEIFDNVGYLINEGGGGSIQGDQIVFSVEVTQKVPLWLRLTAHGNPGHGSAPQMETSVTRILRAGNRIAGTRFPPHLIPAVRAVFEGMAPFQSESIAPLYADIEHAIHDTDFMNYLQLRNPGSHSLLRNTCSITKMVASNKINVVPTEASIELDCRLLPDQDIRQFIDELSLIINDSNIDIEKIMGFTATASSTDTPLFRVIDETLTEHFPGALIIPGVTTGFTDSHFFRDMGIISYGFGPFVIPPADRRGVHGNNERISVENMVRGTRVMSELLKNFTSR